MQWSKSGSRQHTSSKVLPSGHTTRGLLSVCSSVDILHGLIHVLRGQGVIWRWALFRHYIQKFPSRHYRQFPAMTHWRIKGTIAKESETSENAWNKLKNWTLASVAPSTPFNNMCSQTKMQICKVTTMKSIKGHLPVWLWWAACMATSTVGCVS